MKKAVFFDRDGVVNRRLFGAYVRKWDEFEFLPHIGETLRDVKAKGYLAIIITNQRGVGLGLMSEADLHEVHRIMQEDFRKKYKVEFDDIIWCGDATNQSTRRKPAPAMFFEAQKKWDIDLSGSWMIGDSPTDITAGNAAGVQTAFLLNDHENPPNDATILLENVLGIVNLL